MYLVELPAGLPTAVDVTIPAAVRDGQKLRLRGKGGKGRGGGADGDLYLHVRLKPHAIFRADRHDLHFDLALSPWEAALGADPALALGLNTHGGQLTNEAVAMAHGREHVSLASVLG